MNKIIIIFLSILGLRFLFNVYYFCLTKYFYSKYVKFLKKGNWFIKEHRQEIVKVFERAGIEEPFVPYVEPVGYGQIQRGSVSAFKNLSVLREDIVNIINSSFREAIGVYRVRIFQSFNPFFWIEFLAYLPKNILIFFGVKKESLIIKFFQFIYWLISLIGVVVSIFFNKEFINWIGNLL